MKEKKDLDIYNKHISALLKEARLRKGYKIHQVVESLNINEEFLQAIENGQLGKLPPQTYTLGFVRSYAQFLDLDPFLTLDAFKRAHNIQSHKNIVVPSGEELRIVSMTDRLSNPFSFFYNSKKVMVASMVIVVLFLFYRIFTSDPHSFQMDHYGSNIQKSI